LEVFVIDLNEYTPVVFDIETAGIWKEFKDMPEERQFAWERINHGQENHVKAYDEKIALYPEFSKIVCISAVTGDPSDSVVSFIGNQKSDDMIDCESQLLIEFREYLKEIFTNKKDNPILTGHNIGNFDVPFIVARMMISEIPIPGPFKQIVEAKPWERKLFDTKDSWQFGGRKNIPFSLESACLSLGISSPKNSGVEGAQVHSAFHDGRIEEIAHYCELDVKATLALAQRISESWYANERK
jgi:3'-5' exonuclease